MVLHKLYLHNPSIKRDGPYTSVFIILIQDYRDVDYIIEYLRLSIPFNVHINFGSGIVIIPDESYEVQIKSAMTLDEIIDKYINLDHNKITHDEYLFKGLQ